MKTIRLLFCFTLSLAAAATAFGQKSDWVASYNTWYGLLVDALGKLDDYANANSVQKLLQAPELEAARRDFRDAGAATKTRGDELGIACPGMTL